MDFKEKAKNIFASKNLTLWLSFVGLFLISVGVSLTVFSYLKKSGVSTVDLQGLEKARSQIETLPKTEECPINGGMFTKVEKDIWEERRPIVAMIENHADSRPPSGLSSADMVYEAVAEGGITRFMGVFYCAAAKEDVQIAPVRSARIYFVNWAAEYGNYPIFMHVGGANNFAGSGDTVKEAQALEFLEKLGWRAPKGNDFDTTYDSGYPIFWRNYERLDHEVATEHTMMASLDAAYAEAEKRGFGKKYDGEAWDKGFENYKFEDDKALSSPKASKISFDFWEGYGDYSVEWQYDQGTNSYLRFNGGKKHIDLENGQQLSAKNVVILFVKEKGPVDRNKHMIYTTIGEGKALVFQNGDVIEGTWEKKSTEDRTMLYNEAGKEISLVRGTTWFEAVPSGNSVSY